MSGRAPAGAEFLEAAKASACIHCGLCLSACPTYLETGNENDSPRGRVHLMRAVQDRRLAAGATVRRHIDLCLGCRACEVACPSGVAYGELLESTRAYLERRVGRSWFDWLLRRVAIERVFPFPARVRWLVRGAWALRRVGVGRWLPARLREMLELLPGGLDECALPAWSPAAGPAVRGRVGFVQGCVMPVLFGGANAASVALLTRAGYDVLTPPDQGCCGALYAHAGRLEQARACARRNIEAFERAGVDVVIVNAAGCGSTLKAYGHLLAEDERWARRALRFSGRVRDLVEWLHEMPEDPAVRSVGGGWPPRGCDLAEGSVTYHDACHLAHAQRITQAPRALLKRWAGAAYVELAEAEVCCGSAGSYNLTEPEMASRLQRRKAEQILRSGARTVVTTNPGCLLQIRAGLERAGVSDVRVVHLAEVLACAGGQAPGRAGETGAPERAG
jgi:glycolate oxidase iron-sulfur subunit